MSYQQTAPIQPPPGGTRMQGGRPFGTPAPAAPRPFGAPAAPSVPMPQQGNQFQRPYQPNNGVVQFPHQAQRPTQAPQQAESVQRVICKVATKGKFLDFRDNLIPAHAADYSMMHGMGGSKYAPKSTIKLMMTDYGAGPGSSTVVTANITPEFPYQVLRICEENMGTPTLDVKALADCIGSMERETKLPPSNGMEYYAIPGAALAQLRELLKGGAATAGMNFNYRQERVNVYSRNEHGLVPVSVLQIMRNGMRGTEISKMPWMVKVQNFYAPPIQQPNGTTSYNGQQMQGKKEVFINISDADMFRCMKRVIRFIEVWENSYCADIIRQGTNLRNQQRQQNQQSGR